MFTENTVCLKISGLELLEITDVRTHELIFNNEFIFIA